MSIKHRLSHPKLHEACELMVLQYHQYYIIDIVKPFQRRPFACVCNLVDDCTLWFVSAGQNTMRRAYPRKLATCPNISAFCLCYTCFQASLGACQMYATPSCPCHAKFPVSICRGADVIIPIESRSSFTLTGRNKHLGLSNIAVQKCSPAVFSCYLLGTNSCSLVSLECSCFVQGNLLE
jgi:hypothetical protein